MTGETILRLMKKEAKLLHKKLSYQGDHLSSRISRQQIMVREQLVKTRLTEINYLRNRDRLLKFQSDLEIMFMVSDIRRKPRKK